MRIAHDFIDLAGRLAASEAGQATYRTAVSRAYYGVFHLARTLVHDFGFVIPTTANVHVYIQRLLNGSSHTAAQRLASVLGDLHTARNKADYRLDRDRYGTKAFARLNVERAHEARTALSECQQEDIRSLIEQGIREYMRRLSDPN